MMTRSKWLLAGMVIVIASVAAVTAAVRLTPGSMPPATETNVASAAVSEPIAAPAAPATQPAIAAPAVMESAATSSPSTRPAPPVVVKNDPRPEKPAVTSVEPQPSQPIAVKPAGEEPIQGVYNFDTPDLVLPRVIREFKPRYTSDAMRAKVQGDVKVEIIILADGTVGQARVIESLDTVTGLDEEALKAVRQWTFTPGRLNDRTVPVRAEVSLNFRLH